MKSSHGARQQRFGFLGDHLLGCIASFIVYKTFAVGTVCSGVLKPGMDVIFAPGALHAKCTMVQNMGANLEEAFPGDFVHFSVSGPAARAIKRGHVTSAAARMPVKIARRLCCQMFVLEDELKVGDTLTVHCHTAHAVCKLNTLLTKLNPRTGMVAEILPPTARVGDAFMATMIPTEPMCIETYSECASLGTFVGRNIDSGIVVCVGIVKKVQDVDNEDEKSRSQNTISFSTKDDQTWSGVQVTL